MGLAVDAFLFYTASAPSASRSATLQKPRILVVDDEVLYRHILERGLLRAGYSVWLTRDASEAMQIVGAEQVDLVFCDIQMQGIPGLELVRRILEHDAELPCIVMTGYDTPENSVEALRAGAFWYLEKPFEDAHLEVVRRLAEKAIDHSRLCRENRKLKTQLHARRKLDHFIGKSAPLARTLALVERIADTDGTVLVTGESGTGKALVARALHDNSRRANGPFVTVHCGVIPEELLETELFGHTQREGRFAAAHGGTIFLDEIGELSPNLQVKLLRVLEERCFAPVDSSKTVNVEVRVIAATDRKLADRIAEGHFRKDLFDRLSLLPIEVPALRERIEDLPLLIHHFLDVGQQPRGGRVEGVSDGALQRLMDYHWPGNVSELESLIERLSVLVDEREIDVHHLPDSIRAEPALRTWAPRVPSTGLDFNDVVTRFENDLIAQALDQTHWNKNRAAGLLGLNRTTLLEKIKKRGLQRPGSLL